ncbi:YceI family protein [Sedimenticola selenatireducens]|uniref:YceI family protein n=2 Tax=Sedimenticola selenatireducens TaxID=191960 RepID=A0A2N6CSC2_9GAMM|nr:YceI family protein [Sedimenticola selenatireducens]PLX59980.1 MAG: YceI family protein [Sedimenticola selenatireducens]
MKKHLLVSLLTIAGIALAAPVSAERYVIDTQKAHAFVQFKISHLGYSWVLGRFNEFEGSFNYDENNPSASTVSVTVNPASVDSNFAERDKHVRGKDFLKVDEFTTATFNSTGYEVTGENTALLKGDLTLRGITKPIVIDVTQIGAGKDPWGGYRRGFEGTTRLTLADFGIPMDLGPASREVELFLSVEGIRQ